MNLRYPYRIRPLMMILGATIALVAVACGGAAATPTSPPTSTSPPPTATSPAPTATSPAMVEATATAVPEEQRDLGTAAADLMDHPGYRAEWGEPQYGGTLRMRTNVPARAGAAFSGHGNSHYELPAYTMNDSLVEVDPWLGWEGGVRPNLAKSWEISSDGLTYTFHLREGIHFRSGTEWDAIENMPGLGQEVNCEDVQATMEFIGSQRWWDEGGSLSVMIDGRDHTWSCPDGPDGYTVVGVLDKGIPTPGLLMQLAIQAVHGIVNKDWLDWYVETYEPRWIVTGEFTAHVGTGPWLPVSLTPETKNVMAPNPNYWKPGLPFLDSFEFHTIPDPATAFAAWATAKIDVMGHGSGSMYPEQVAQAVRDFPEKPIIANHYYGARNIGWNSERPPFDDVRVRRAIHLAYDRQLRFENERVPGSDLHYGIIAGFFNGVGQPHNPMGNSIEEILTWPGFNPATKDADIAEGNRLMDEVFGPGERPGPFKCVTRNDATSINECLYGGEIMSKNLGMPPLELDLYDPARLSSVGCSYTIQPTVVPSWDATPDPYLRYRRFNTANEGFRICMGGVDPDLQSKINGLISDMQKELDFEKRATISREIEYLLINEHLISAPYGWQYLFHGTQPWLRGWWAHNQAVHTGHIKVWERTWTVN